MAFTISERHKMLEEYFSLLRAMRGDGNDADIAEAGQRLLEVVHRYEEGLPRVPLSRCPLSGELVLHTFDPYGLDGLWWNYEAPVRPLMERFVTCLAVTGAVKLAAEVKWTPFLCRPGPGVPYVYPKLLDLDGMYGVVYSMPVGRHTAYPILYFAEGPVTGVEMPNSWGTAVYWDDTDGNPGWYETPELPEEWDFDLGIWMEAGKLFWIAPGDRDMELRSDLAECPYLDLPDVREIQRICYGKVHLDSEIPELEETHE